MRFLVVLCDFDPIGCNSLVIAGTRQTCLAVADLLVLIRLLTSCLGPTAPSAGWTWCANATGLFIGESRGSQGETVARFEANTRDMVELAAAAGMPDALFELGLMYCSGRGVDLDLVEAHKWFNLAAARGSEDARRYRSEIAREMTRCEIGEAQRRARGWLGRA
jgi:uncharacterized protein